MKKRNRIKVRRKNPNNEIYKYFDRIEHLLIKYKYLFDISYNHNRCKDVIFYYLMFLYGLRRKIYSMEGIDVVGVVYGLGIESIVKSKIKIMELIDDLHSELEFVRNLKDEERISSENLHSLIEIYELLEINYKEFFKDIQICLKK